MNTNPLLHPLHTDAEPPQRFNNPFYYTPDALCQQAMAELVGYLEGRPGQSFAPTGLPSGFREEIDEGKMFGVLVVSSSLSSLSSPSPNSLSPNPSPEGEGNRNTPSGTFPSPSGEGLGERLSSPSSLFYLAAYSGQIMGRSDWPGFVPAVFDYLQPDGYFKREEAAIVALNHELGQLPRPQPWNEEEHAAGRPEAHRQRREGESEADYIRRRQFENAELHRWKLGIRAEREAFEAVQQGRRERIAALKTLRRQKSDALQTWLFRQFVMRNARGESKDLVEIKNSLSSPSPSPSPEGEGNVPKGGLRSPSPSGEGLGERLERLLPPAGSGECCEPRLLQYAFTHGMRPVSMAMFWWGRSPRKEVRHHLQCYPACNGKCKPILGWMLQGMDVEPHPLERPSRHSLETVYEDAAICVVNKPAGMLSVQGKSARESVQSAMRARYPEATGPLIVHRLDMATSGLMVVAKTMEAYRELQRQFARHEVRKRYVAVLEHDVAQLRGDIALPLRPDIDDRPRQVVDAEHGKAAFTHFERVGTRRVALYPRTGRTHQLRLHCAHAAGLANPIRGDELYGRRAERLYLHAEYMMFRHPATGCEVEFEAKAPF